MIPKRRPGIFIPTLYFAEGLPYTIVNMVAALFFKSLGASNVFVGLASALSMPWILKFAWSPLVDFYGSKRMWVIIAQFVLAALTGVLAFISIGSQHMGLDAFTILGVVVLFAIAFASATQDVAIDAYYLDVLDEDQKAFFVGVRNSAYKAAWLFGSGGLVFLAGWAGERVGLGQGWSIAFGVAAAAMLACALFHKWYLPHVASTGPVINPVKDASPAPTAKLGNFWRAIATYFDQPSIGAIVMYILLFRLGDALMLKQAPNFLLDPVSKGGFGLTVADVGIINGTVGMIFLLVGGIVGSWLISRDGLKKWFWPTAIFQNAAILLYWLLAFYTPQIHASTSVGIFGMKPGIEWVYIVNSIEQFAYGLGVAAYTVFLLSTVRSEYKAAHYATATALMALGLMVPQMASGYLYEWLGYANFFLVSFFCSIPGIIAIFYLPIWQKDWSQDGRSGESARGVQTPGQVGSESK